MLTKRLTGAALLCGGLALGAGCDQQPGSNQPGVEGADRANEAQQRMNEAARDASHEVREEAGSLIDRAQGFIDRGAYTDAQVVVNQLQAMRSRLTPDLQRRLDQVAASLSAARQRAPLPNAGGTTTAPSGSIVPESTAPITPTPAPAQP